MHVRLQALSACARSRPTDRVDDLDEDGFDGARLDLVVVGLDACTMSVLPVPAREVGAYERMRPLVLMGHGLSQIVEEGRALAERDVETELSGDESREVAALDEVREHVLTFDVR